MTNSMNKITINFIDIFDFFIENIQTETKQNLTFEHLIMLRETNKIIKEISDKIQPFVKVIYLYKTYKKNQLKFFFNSQEMLNHFKIISLEVENHAIATSDPIKSLINLISNNHNMKHINQINLSNYKFEIQEFIKLSVVFNQYKYLDHLNLQCNHFGPKETKILTGVLVQCPGLSRLDLRYNEIRSEGAEILAKVIPLCTSLRYLDIGWNYIHSNGLENFARMFSQCTTLTSLDISDNNDNPNYHGFVSFVGMLPWSESLVNINLSTNGIKNVGEILSHSTSLTELNLYDNNISIGELSNLAKMFRHCKIYK